MPFEKKVKDETAETPSSNVPSEWIAAADVQQMVNKAVNDALEKLAELPGKQDDDDVITKLGREIALNTAMLADQGTGRKRVAPDIQMARDAARERMFLLIDELSQEDEAPLYELRHKVYLEEVLVDPYYIDANHIQQPMQIEWRGAPSEVMRPLNEPAQQIFSAFRDSIGDTTLKDSPMRVTPGGLVVIGADRKSTPQVSTPGPASNMLAIRGRKQTTKRVNVLGTVAAAAEQTL